MLGFRKEKPEQSQTPSLSGNSAQGAQPRHVGELLLLNGQITQEQLDQALQEQKQNNAFLGRILVNHNAISQDELTSSLVKYCKIPHLSLQGYDISASVLELLPRDICEKHHVLPIDKLGRILTVAMVDPLNLAALEEVKEACPELRIKPILCNWQHFEQVFKKASNKREGQTVTMQSFGFAPGGAPAEQTKAKKNQPPANSDNSANTNATAQQAPTPKPEAPEPAAPPPQAEPQLSSKEIADSIRESVQEAFQETAAILRTHLNVLQSSKSPAGSPVEDMHRLADVMKNSIREAMHEALATAKQSQTTAAGSQAHHGTAFLPPEQFTHMMRDAVRDAMKEAVGSLMSQMKVVHEGGDGVSYQYLHDGQDLLVSALQSGLQEVLETTRLAYSEQESRLAALAEATLQSVQQTSHLLESNVVKQQGKQNLAGKHRNHQDSVAPFNFSPTSTSHSPGDTSDSNQEAHENADALVREALESQHPLESLTFDTFIPGRVNEFTHRLSKAVAEHPGENYNPYFLYGNVGIGKTHLISAMGNAIQQWRPHLRVGYVSASHFSKRLADAMQDGQVDLFRAGYCCWDVLILDDIQFMGGRVDAQEEFFHIFNVLHQQGRQIIIAGDKAPDQLGLLEERLVSRFASGIVAELKAPEWETRMAILRMFAESKGMVIQEEILSLIAMRVSNDIRKMTGSLRKVLAYADLVQQDITCELANDILSHLGAIDAA